LIRDFDLPFLLIFELGGGAVINFSPCSTNPRNGSVYASCTLFRFCIKIFEVIVNDLIAIFSNVIGSKVLVSLILSCESILIVPNSFYIFSLYPNVSLGKIIDGV